MAMTSAGMNVERMTHQQRSVLIYLETRAVDHGGLVDTRMMNKQDMDIVDAWVAAGYIGFGRVQAKDVELTGCTHWVTIGELALAAAHAERKARIIRVWTQRQWRKSSEASTK